MKMVRERDPKKFDPALAPVLDAAEREQYLPSERVVAMLELEGSETVLDYGAGTGQIALAVATAIPHGRILAADESSEMLTHLEKRLAGIENAQAVLISSNRVPLRDGEADRILAVNLLHEIRGETALAEMRRVIAADGILLVIDWERGRPRPPGPPDDRLLYSAAEASDELHRAGFNATEVTTELPYHFAIGAVATRPKTDGG
jgi:ubiquinone/menaquinone biosynthesis C-methylase UbiE